MKPQGRASATLPASRSCVYLCFGDRHAPLPCHQGRMEAQEGWGLQALGEFVIHCSLVAPGTAEWPDVLLEP